MGQETISKPAPLPLLLSNLKKAFGKNIQGPIQYREHEFGATAKPAFISELVKFLANRGVTKLAAMNAWDSEKDLKISYHFIAKIGNDFQDSKITIITYLPLDDKSLKSIKKIYPNARLFEDEISQQYEITFTD